jgi:hypothetical protein
MWWCCGTFIEADAWYNLWLVLLIQDLAGAIDEVDVVKFTDIVKEYDNMSRIVCCFSVQPPSLISVWCWLFFPNLRMWHWSLVSNLFFTPILCLWILVHIQLWCWLSCHSGGRKSGFSEQMLNYVDSSGNESMASVKGGCVLRLGSPLFPLLLLWCRIWNLYELIIRYSLIAIQCKNGEILNACGYVYQRCNTALWPNKLSWMSTVRLFDEWLVPDIDFRPLFAWWQDQWKTTLLLRAKNALKLKEIEEPDLL